jgi:hypothetical protein
MNINENELVMFKNDKSNVIQSGGYKINSILKKYNTPLMRSLNTNSENNNEKKNKISSIYDELAIPAGLLYLQDVSKKIINNNDIINNMNNLNKNSINMDNIKYNKKELIDDSLYDKLFKLASLTDNSKNKSKTKSRIIKSNSKSTKSDDKNKKTKRVRFSKYNKTRRFYK